MQRGRPLTRNLPRKLGNNSGAVAAYYSGDGRFDSRGFANKWAVTANATQ